MLTIKLALRGANVYSDVQKSFRQVPFVSSSSTWYAVRQYVPTVRSHCHEIHIIYRLNPSEMRARSVLDIHLETNKTYLMFTTATTKLST